MSLRSLISWSRPEFILHTEPLSQEAKEEMKDLCKQIRASRDNWFVIPQEKPRIEYVPSRFGRILIGVVVPAIVAAGVALLTCWLWGS